jgi:hypothetical protein
MLLIFFINFLTISYGFIRTEFSIQLLLWYIQLKKDVKTARDHHSLTTVTHTNLAELK